MSTLHISRSVLDLERTECECECKSLARAAESKKRSDATRMSFCALLQFGAAQLLLARTNCAPRACSIRDLVAMGKRRTLFRQASEWRQWCWCSKCKRRGVCLHTYIYLLLVAQCRRAEPSLTNHSSYLVMTSCMQKSVITAPVAT